MTVQQVVFRGGPNDGQTDEQPLGEPIAPEIGFIPDHDPATVAIYGLHSIKLTEAPQLIYAYRATVPMST
ncbi:hypothetical protein ACWGDS_25905 [Streptomyces sp. NPDC055059]